MTSSVLASALRPSNATLFWRSLLINCEKTLPLHLQKFLFLEIGIGVFFFPLFFYLILENSIFYNCFCFSFIPVRKITQFGNILKQMGALVGIFSCHKLWTFIACIFLYQFAVTWIGQVNVFVCVKLHVEDTQIFVE